MYLSLSVRNCQSLFSVRIAKLKSKRTIKLRLHLLLQVLLFKTKNMFDDVLVISGRQCVDGVAVVIGINAQIKNLPEPNKW